MWSCWSRLLGPPARSATNRPGPSWRRLPTRRRPGGVARRGEQPPHGHRDRALAGGHAAPPKSRPPEHWPGRLWPFWPSKGPPAGAESLECCVACGCVPGRRPSTLGVVRGSWGLSLAQSVKSGCRIEARSCANAVRLSGRGAVQCHRLAAVVCHVAGAGGADLRAVCVERRNCKRVLPIQSWRLRPRCRPSAGATLDRAFGVFWPKVDREPGVTVLWRGFQAHRLTTMSALCVRPPAQTFCVRISRWGEGLAVTHRFLSGYLR